KMSFGFFKHLKPEPFIETSGRIYFQDMKRNRLLGRFDQLSDQFRSDAEVLKLGKEMYLNKKCFVFFFVGPEVAGVDAVNCDNGALDPFFEPLSKVGFLPRFIPAPGLFNIYA